MTIFISLFFDFLLFLPRTHKLRLISIANFCRLIAITQLRVNFRAQ